MNNVAQSEALQPQISLNKPETMASITEIFAAVSHELRTPLNAVVGAARVLNYTKLDDKQKEILKVLQENAETLLKVADLINSGSNLTPQAFKDIVYKDKIDPTVKNEIAPMKNHVLLVEDYPSNAMVASMILEEMGYTVDVATDGMEAIEKISNQSRPYHVILMDVQMFGMDGFEATKKIRMMEKEKGYRNCIIGVTAHALAGDRERCLEAGMDDYMSKPIQPNMLSHKLGAASQLETSE